MSYQEALQWIHSLYLFGSKLGLGRMEEMLKRLGNPHKLLRCVHIAGTNGKGSTAVMLAEIFKAQGFKTALYTSPYLESFTNRMAVNGTDINETDLINLVGLIRPLTEEIALSELGQPTQFEVVTVLAFLYFARCKPDWVVVEVGLGGRFDATNVIVPEVSVITNIGLDHTQVLGDTVEAIAFEKAGIIKAGVPVVTAAEKKPALSVIEETARRQNAPLTVIGRDVFYSTGQASIEGQVFDYQSKERKIFGLGISLPGRHQARNAATALAARELIPGLVFDEPAARCGLAATNWPGRLEVLSRKPLVLIDGAHNVDGVAALREALVEILAGRKLHLVLGFLGDKAIEDMLRLIVPLASAGLVVTRPDNQRAADPYSVAALVSSYTAIPALVVDDVSLAVTLSLHNTKDDEVLCVTGSLFTISNARKTLKDLLVK